jgi:hypothetical protein
MRAWPRGFRNGRKGPIVREIQLTLVAIADTISIVEVWPELLVPPLADAQERASRLPYALGPTQGGSSLAFGGIFTWVSEFHCESG